MLGTRQDFQKFEFKIKYLLSSLNRKRGNIPNEILNSDLGEKAYFSFKDNLLFT